VSSTTPAAAVSAHRVAINARDPGRSAATVAVVSCSHNGHKLIIMSTEELPERSPPFARSEIRQLDILATTGDLVVYALYFQGYHDDGRATGTRPAWGVHRAASLWPEGLLAAVSRANPERTGRVRKYSRTDCAATSDE